MKNKIADSIIRCLSCQTRFALRDSGLSCPNCGEDVDDNPVVAKALDLPDFDFQEAFNGAFSSILAGADVDEAIKEFRAVVNESIRALRKTASKTIPSRVILT